MSFLPHTGDPPFTFHFQEVTQRGEKLMARGRKCRKKKKTWQPKTMRTAERKKTTQTPRYYNETATRSTSLLLVILELRASTPWSKEIIWVNRGWRFI